MTSGAFAVAPYVGFLAPVAALSLGLPFIVGGAIFSAVAIALSAVVISKNNTISEKDAQLAKKDNKAFGIMEKLSKEGTNLDYLDLAVLSSRQEKQANGLDYLNIDNVPKQFDLSSIDAAKKHLMSLVEKDINEDISYDAEPGEEKSTENPNPENGPAKEEVKSSLTGTETSHLSSESKSL
ncbi:MAG: hypothetical protein ACR5K9_05470 [Wolbachia sp.]